MKIAVIGADGQLGSELCRQQPHAVPLSLPELDLTSPPTIRSVLTRVGADAVINVAAFTQVDEAEAQPELCRAINADAIAPLAEVCRELDSTLVQLSTDYVFGAPSSRSTPYTESAPPSPRGVYAQTKLDGEHQARAIDKHLIVRTCGLYGRPGLATPKSSFVDTMLRLGGERDQLRVIDDQTCTPSYVPHVARALLFLTEQGAHGLYHVTNRGATTWYDFAVEIFRQAGLSVDVERITTTQYGAAAPRPSYSVLDTAKYHALGGPTMPTWQEALSEYLKSIDRLAQE